MPEDENIQCWVDFWKASVRNREAVTDEVQAARWNGMADHFGKGMDGERRHQRMAGLFALLNEAGFSPEGAKVLDIGCGPGALSLPMARAGAKVTSLDISGAMLARLQETAREEGLAIDTAECSWWSADIDELGFRNTFDLVIASSTPAIKDVETFDRMMACSRKYCYYSGFIGMGEEKEGARHPISEILGEEVRKGHAFGPGGRAHGGPGMLYPFMYLYTLGVRPLLKFSGWGRNEEQGWAEAAEKAIERFGRNRQLSDGQKQKIRDYYRDAAIDGRYKPERRNISCMMVWTVKNRDWN
ncbi:MAG: Mg-protoporphyrin IX methyl transferase [Methanoregulaceae archaeon PtaB.Bin056]|jgi:SAM-dependent methyltransferase|nr:MAG: Mg-protoporphyrin IX methyl transferase [Methanoregulaceae archaeon PtaB.Bin056]